jgi:CO/xanthine dehydrogenase FAD-binding subunit
MPINFKYIKPKNFEELSNLIQMFGDRITYLAGGTDFVPDLKRGRIKPEIVLNISDIPELNKIEIRNYEIHIGSAVTFARLQKSPEIERYVPALKVAASQVGSPQIRSIATIGGNIATASPAGDSLPGLCAHRASIILVHKNSERTVSVLEYLNESSIQKKNDLIKAIVIPISDQVQTKGTFVKLGRRNALSIARINGALVVKHEDGYLKEVHLFLGAVGKIPIRLDIPFDIMETLLSHGKFDFYLVKNIADLAADAIRKSIPDRESLPYKQRAVRGVIFDLMRGLFNG